MEYFVFWLVFTAIAIIIASTRGVNVGYTFLWCLLMPLAGIIYAFAAKSGRKQKIENTMKMNDES
jgi:4-hydroxybenzoate polyprenyltransferase